MSRRSYTKYKPSGVEWLGEIPEHWDILECKFGYSIQLGKMLQNDPQTANDEKVPYLKALHVQWGNISISDPPEMWASPGDLVKYSVGDDDLLVCEGGEVGRAGILRNPPAKCIIQNALHRVRPKGKNSNRFLMYLLKVTSCQGWFNILCNKATIAHFTGEKFGWLSITLPPHSEQEAIVAFLERETARIDALMEKKQRQIELLQEKCAALISHAVTKGLNPDVKMKSSGIEWLGKIPRGWKVKRIKHVGKIKYGLGEPPKQLEDGLPFIRATDIHRGKINSEAILKVDPHDIPWSRDPELHTNDILVVRSGAYTGDSAIVSEQWVGAIAGYDMVLRVTGAVPQFVAYALLSKYLLYGQIYLERSRAAQPHLNAEELGSFIFLLPPKPEQEAIVSYLDLKTKENDALIEKIKDSISILSEYRTALISAAVTGKIDVREAAA